jgi:hypothetical protein
VINNKIKCGKEYQCDGCGEWVDFTDVGHQEDKPSYKSPIEIHYFTQCKKCCIREKNETSN